MEPIIAVLVGFLIGCSTYLMLQRNLIRFVLGLALISHAANLLIFASGGLTRGFPALIMAGETRPQPGVANAVPQALILTAIVISFSVLTFALVLAFRAYQRLQTVDTDAMRAAEPPVSIPPARPEGEVSLS
jgi:multicomponent Na+:H+ antiporter subunit C